MPIPPQGRRRQKRRGLGGMQFPPRGLGCPQPSRPPYKHVFTTCSTYILCTSVRTTSRAAGLCKVFKLRLGRRVFNLPLNVKKGEEWINTLSPPVTYLLRCNSDVTSLLSGTAIKAIVAYISDYVTKPGLKTYAIFDAIRHFSHPLTTDY
ncbi:uncharacterized protein LACBIDRAFT_296823 [Laccaria bicolor S238N-H82]|uniref:Predicted protein n=1 Tax=Laccaria bicolor (strain S238N-H82 / ATCC MYA-4686) TaxID=486041 RepID=B0E363_LACBS|nr:uncharacterized protein LACBIDRAFT_296823 [Laccaria bicolor S238N-H82]EDQ98717.1 predicted protein [Laccaria bicolor S238N-H82]|eukprot:XP_001890631.1 predicted protein [Laccaria bicolor S238N-H82]